MARELEGAQPPPHCGRFQHWGVQGRMFTTRELLAQCVAQRSSGPYCRACGQEQKAGGREGDLPVLRRLEGLLPFQESIRFRIERGAVLPRTIDQGGQAED